MTGLAGGLAGGLAVLPMYDRPEIRAETDALWAALRDRIRAAGLAAPDALDRETEAAAAWESPDLVLGQTCGLPFARRLAGRVTLVGAPDYGIEGCPPGHYRSVLVARADDPRDGLAGFAGATAAVNEPGSQSGHAALLGALAAAGLRPGAVRLTGGHAASARAVAAGAADLAALDAVSWRLIRRFEPAAAALRVVALTPPTPALPYIAAAGADAPRLAAAAAAAIASLAPATRDALGLRGFVALAPADYAPLAARFAALSEALPI